MRLNHFRTQLLALFVGLTIVLTGCGKVESESLDAPLETPITSVESGAFTTSYEFAEEDVRCDWDENSAARISFDGNTAQVSGAGAAFSEGRLTIERAGTYVLTGTLGDGQVLIDVGKKDIVRLVLDGVSLRNETDPAIYAPKSAKVVLILEEGTENKVSDGTVYTAVEDGDGPDAAIYVQNDLSITGGGTLTVHGNHRHGIRAQDILAVTGGVIYVNAVGDALRGRDGVAIQNGSFTLEAGGDGIQSNNDKDDKKGFVFISSGAFSIQTQSDGIQAETSLTVADGSFQITTGGSSANAPAQEDFRGGWGGRGGRQEPIPETNDESISMKALKAGKQIYITGGDFTIDAEDDGIHSNDHLLIASGKFHIQTGDDGIHADAAVEISGGEITIPVCYEGIEGLSVTISGGEHWVIASDDAINAAGGVDSASPMGGRRDRFAVNGDIFIRVSGGTLTLFASHDGIDANGNIFLEGGHIAIDGPSMGMEGAIDLDGTMLVTGGELITAGSVLNASVSSAQPVILVSYTRRQAPGSVITIKDAAGNTILEYTSRTDYSMSGFTSPLFALGNTYSLFIDDEKRTDIRLDSIITSVSDDGSVYNGGRGGGRGNWGGDMPQGDGNGPGRGGPFGNDNRMDRTPP